MSAIDDLLDRNRAYTQSFPHGSLPAPPSLGVAVVTCMDARIDVYRALGLEPGQAHVIRNAGGVVTDDVIRSLAISQRLLGTTEVMVVLHTGCGMTTFRDDEERGAIQAETGVRPSFALEAFGDVDAEARQGLARLAASPFVRADPARGFVYDVATGDLREVR